MHPLFERVCIAQPGLDSPAQPPWELQAYINYIQLHTSRSRDGSRVAFKHGYCSTSVFSVPLGPSCPALLGTFLDFVPNVFLIQGNLLLR